MNSFTISLALLASLPAAAQAQQPAQPLRVAYADLNLASPAGVRALDQRLAAATRIACGVDDGTIGLTIKAAERRCLAETRADLAAQRSRAVAAATPGPGALALAADGR